MSARTVLGIAAVVGGLVLSRRAEPPGTGGPETPSGSASRLLGPLADIAADVRWFQVERALRDGLPTRAILSAERAVTLAPEDVLGWTRYASLVGTHLGSPETEPDPATRLAWVRAAQRIYARGAAAVADATELHLAEAALLVSRVDTDPDLPWPDGPSEPWRLAAEAFDRATRHAPHAAELAAAARRFAAEATDSTEDP